MDIVLNNGGTMNETHLIYLWDTDSQGYVKVIYENFDDLPYFQVYDGYIRAWWRCFYIVTVETLIWDGNRLIKESEILVLLGGREGEPPPISITLNGALIHVGYEPIIENGRVFANAYEFFRAFCDEASIDYATDIVTARMGNSSISLQIGSEIMWVDGEAITLDVSSKKVNFNRLIPVRSVSENLGAVVEWDEENRQVVIEWSPAQFVSALSK
jgi:hypothetical protein